MPSLYEPEDRQRVKVQGHNAKPLTVVCSGGGYFQIRAEALAMMRRSVQDGPAKPDAGGVLLGRHILGTGDIIVDCITAPMPSDRQSRFRFFRARRPQQAAIDHAWRANGGPAPIWESGTHTLSNILHLRGSTTRIGSVNSSLISSPSRSSSSLWAPQRRTGGKGAALVG